MHTNNVSTHSGTLRSPRPHAGDLRRRRLLDLADQVRRLSVELAAVTNQIDDLASETDEPTLAAATLSLLTVEDVAERLRMSRTAVFALLRGGSLRSVQIGNRRRVPAAALDDYVASLSGAA